MTRFALMLPLLAAALPAAAQMPAPESPAEAPTPRGTYLVYADEQGSAFVSIEPSLADAGVWPMRFFYFQDGSHQGTAQMRGTADCMAGVVSGQLTGVTGPGGEAMADLQGEELPAFSFDRAAGGGDEAIVGFICGTRQERLVQAETPVAGTPREAADTYARLRTLGLEDRLARSLAIRDLATAGPLIASAVPEELRTQVRLALTDRD
jgi:hypothetical protein